MKKYLLVALVSAGTACALYGQGKIDLPGSQLLQNMLTSREAVLSRNGDVRAIAPEYDYDQKVLVLVTLNDSMTADDLRAQGIDIADARANMVMARLTSDQIQALSEYDGVKSMSVGTIEKAHMIVARDNGKVTAVQNGTDGLDGVKFTGAGVLCGLMDNGFDPNHINFKKDGELRVKRMWSITGANSAVNTYSTPERIAAYSTDDPSNTHGTHVLGIMAGSYRGKGKYAFINANGVSQTRSSGDIPYYGVAYDADLAVCCGTTERNNLILAAGFISDFARETGMPAVMNLSLGSNIGPHDGKDDSVRYLDEVAKDIIVCVSAGNEGGEAVSYEKTFSASDKQVKTFLSASSAIEGGADIWSSDSKMLKVTFVAVEKATGAVKYSYTLDRNTAGKSVYVTGDYYNAAGYIHDPVFNSAFGEKGSLIMSSNVNPNNNRYNVYVSLNLQGKSSNGIVPGIIVEGEAGSTAYIYRGGSSRLMSLGIAGYVDGNDKGSINGLGCGHNVLTVGSYTNSSSWGSFTGTLSFQNKPVTGAISDFSSYGTTFDGRKLPLIVGPGEGVVSSISTPYYDAGGLDNNNRVSAQVSESKRQNYWHEMSGTSMSSPYVAGVMALWLQADPTLKIDDVKKILQETADHDEFTAVTPERWGYGKINALAGIKKVLNLAGVAGVAADNDDMIVSSLGGNSYEVFAAGANGVSADLYSMSGMQVASYSDNGDNLVVNTDGLASGVYVMKATANGKSLSKKIVVK